LPELSLVRWNEIVAVPVTADSALVTGGVSFAAESCIVKLVVPEDVDPLGVVVVEYPEPPHAAALRPRTMAGIARGFMRSPHSKRRTTRRSQ
jgi:hypothetical protein